MLDDTKLFLSVTANWEHALSFFGITEVYIDEDEYWDPESVSSGNYRNFSGTLQVKCAAQSNYSEDLTRRVIMTELSP